LVIWKSKRAARFATSVAMGVAIALVVPAGTASAAAVDNPSPNAAVNQPSRPDTPDAHTMNPSPSAPSSGVGQGPSAPSAGPPASPPQRKDPPPDRAPHKFSPARHPAAGSGSSPGDNKNNRDRDSVPATPLPVTGSRHGAPGPQVTDPPDIRRSTQALNVWVDSLKCGAAIAVAIGGIALPAAKILQIRKLIKAVGGVQKLATKIIEAFKLVRKGKSIGAAVQELFGALGSTIVGIAAEVLGIDAVVQNCT
jgi:hypothetical protein